MSNPYSDMLRNHQQRNGGTKPFKKLQILNGDLPAYAVYEQAVHWESLRAHYHTMHANLVSAADATARAAHYTAVLESFPERGHLYAAPQGQRWP